MISTSFNFQQEAFIRSDTQIYCLHLNVNFTEAPPPAGVAGDDGVDNRGGDGDAAEIPQPAQGADGVAAEPGVVDIIDFTGAEASAFVDEHK